ncbi:MAG TPA: hypothetical protein VFR02_02495, partial [bacterium]|nr:hypothetical protein [bacterium]
MRFQIFLAFLRSSFIPAIALAAPALGAGPSAPATLVFEGQDLLVLRSPILSFTPADRTAAISAKLHRFATDPLFDPSTLAAEPGDGSTAITAGDVVLMSVTDADARDAGLKREALADRDLALFRRTLSESHLRYGPRAFVKGGLETLALTLVLLGILAGLRWVHHKAWGAVEGARTLLASRLGIQRLQLLSPRQAEDLVKGLLNLMRAAASLFFFYVDLSLVLGFFPWTASFSGRLFGYFWSPLGA